MKKRSRRPVSDFKLPPPPPPAPREIMRYDLQVNTRIGYDYRLMLFPDDEKSRDQIAKGGWHPVPYVDFGGALPGKDGFVSIHGQTLMRQMRPQLTTASLGGTTGFVVVSFAISEMP